MTFTGRRMALAGIIDIVLPGETIRLCEDGLVKLDGETYRAKHPDWGMMGEVDAIEESIGDEAPGLSVDFLPISPAAGAALAAAANQLAPVRLRLARYDYDTGIAEPEDVDFVADLLLDDAGLSVVAQKLRLGLISAADRLMTIDKGNVLSDAFHQLTWPGEFGLANAIDGQKTVAWRVQAPPRGSASGFTYGGAGGSGGGGGAQWDPLMPGGARQS